MTPSPHIDSARLQAELHHLATFTEPPTGPPGNGEHWTPVIRIVFTEQDREARAYLRSLAEAAHLSIRTDAIGNTFFRWQGTEPDLPAIATGSHIDAIPNAGMYDGTVGVLGGLEAIRSLQAAGFTPRRSIELILFTSEEPTRFGLGCLGSRLLSGALTPAAAHALRDPQGHTLDEVRTAAGFHGSLDQVQLQPAHYAAFVELHIEQGPILELEHTSIGIVTHISAPAAAAITVQGEGGHAGAMLMHIRHDALAAAAEIILAVERSALATHAPDTVATVGRCDVFPGNVNAVPSRVTLSLDVRDIDERRRDDVLEAIDLACRYTAKNRRVAITNQILNRDSPAACDAATLNVIEGACRAADTSHLRLVSRAYHDALFMARLCPIAMIFIPSHLGLSHRPDEYSTPESIAQGTSILAQTLATLSTQ